MIWISFGMKDNCKNLILKQKIGLGGWARKYTFFFLMFPSKLLKGKLFNIFV
jgi:hypothetical protein